ncbi:LysR family transcriptional regulator [Desulfitibacter alkalitolerans]|uniref:LysR family transcriptional regulator n=1 Tax=Desulfitibacter alkalitolerans TaxID=264641 RepID=UPI0004884395|nr:LysR family transcriptional regulator [Desulfitibacter alkalitolerans]
MNLEYLKTFYITVRCNSISKAAKLLHMSQPGVSMQIQSLEKELGVNLLNRSNKGVELTEEGEVVYDYAVSLLAIQDNIERQLNCIKNKQTEIIVSSCTTVGSYALPCSLYTFREKNPNVNILLDITNSANVIKKIIDGSTRIGIIEGKPFTNSVTLTKVTSDKLKLVVSPKRYKKPEISVKEFLKIPIILRESGSGTKAVVVEAMNQANIDLNEANIIMEIGSPEAIKSAVVAGKGYSIFSQLAIKKELATGVLKEVKISEVDFNADYFLVHSPDYVLKGAEKDFAEFIKSKRRGFC